MLLKIAKIKDKKVDQLRFNNFGSGFYFYYWYFYADLYPLPCNDP